MMVYKVKLENPNGKVKTMDVRADTCLNAQEKAIASLGSGDWFVVAANLVSVVY